MRRIFTIALALLAAAPAAAQTPTPYQRAVAAGYKAAVLCSGIFDGGRSEAQIAADELRDIYPEYNAIVPTLTAKVDRATATVTVAFDDTLPPRRAVWNKATGCTAFPIGSPPPPIVSRYATPPAPAPADPRAWPMGDAGIAPKPSPEIAAAVAKAFDASTYGNKNNTIAVVVLKDGKVVAERYRDGWGPFMANRTWSVGKSIGGTLVGMAVGDGTLDPKAPARIPEWAEPGDPRHAITLDNLLRMGSGLHSDTAGNRTDAIYFGGATVTEDATKWSLEAAPGTRFRYANNDILLAMRSLRAAVDDKTYAAFPATRLFAPLGMTHTHAGTDWQGNYIISSQVWTTARDLARLGQFWLQDGVWQGKRLLPSGWMAYMTTPTGPQPEGRAEGYGASIWLHLPSQGLPAGSYSALGNRGQSVTIVPAANLIVVRRAEEATPFDVARFVGDIVAATK